MEPHVYFPSCTEEETIQDAPEQHMLGIGVVQPATMMLTISGGTVLQQVEFLFILLFYLEIPFFESPCCIMPC